MIHLRRFLWILLGLLLLAGAGELQAQQKPAAKSQSSAKSQPKSGTKPSTKSGSKPKSKSSPKVSRAEYERQQKELQKQIEATERMISDNKQSVLGQDRNIRLLEDEIGKRQSLLDAMALEIEAIEQEEDSLQQVIEMLQISYEERKQKYAEAVRHAFKWRHGYDAWQYVLSANNAMESVRRVRYLQQYADWRHQEATLLRQEREATELAQQEKAAVLAQKAELKQQVEAERQNLAAKQQKHRSAKVELEKRDRELRTELASAKKRQREIQQKIQDIINEERRKAEEARKQDAAKSNASGSKPGKGSSSGSSTKPSSGSSSATHTPTAVDALTGSFRQNKGKMPYPIDSNYAFLSHYTNDGNYSITLATSVGAHARAIYEGTVLRVERSAEDVTVIISHGDYMTVYSNLATCQVKEKQKVKMNQTIGTVKADIDGKHGELMFWISGKNNFENPENWLKR